MVALTQETPLERIEDPLHALFDGGRERGLLDIHGNTSPSLTCELRLANVPTLISLLRGGKHTGALAVLWPGGGRALFFERGELTGCTTTHKADRLGEVLWRAGKITLDQLIIAGAHLGPGVKLGRCLVELGYLQSADLYACLKMQAAAVLQEACLMEEGVAAFVDGVTLRNPLRMMDETRAVIGSAFKLSAECKALERDLGSMDAVVLPSWPMTPPLDEAEAAMLQLAASATPPMTRTQLLDRVELGRLEGLRTLHRLMRRGVVVTVENQRPARNDDVDVSLTRLERLQRAVERVMGSLHDAGYGTVDCIGEFLLHPPVMHRKALAAVRVEQGALTVDWVKIGALDDGSQQLEDALAALLDFAMFEARDTLDDASLGLLVDEMIRLGVVSL